MEDLIGRPFLDIDSKENFKKYSNIAASTQKILEAAIDLMLQKIKKITNKKKIVLCGGVSLNCKAITDVAKNHSDIEIFVPPSPGDSGSAIGAAFFALYQESKKLNFWAPPPPPSRPPPPPLPPPPPPSISWRILGAPQE